MTTPTSPGSPLPPGGEPPHPPDAGTRQLRRSATDRMLGGVCGGLADYSGIDVVLWRVGFVALTLAGGSGVVLYALLWVLVPAEPLPPDRQPSALEAFVGRLHEAVQKATGRRG